MSKIYKYPVSVEQFILENYLGRTTKELTEMLNEEFSSDGFTFTAQKVKCYKSNHHLRSGSTKGRAKGFASNVFPENVKNFIRENYEGIGPSKMAEILNKTFGMDYKASQLKSFYANHKLNSGIDGRFKKGSVPFTKGKKQSDYMSRESIEKTKATRFQKKHIPYNKMKVGDLTHTTDGYLVRKIAEPNVWDFEARLVWREHHGEIPENGCIIYLDGNKNNCCIDNLELVDNSVNLELNRRKLRLSNQELTKSAVILSKLCVATRNRKKNN